MVTFSYLSEAFGHGGREEEKEVKILSPEITIHEVAQLAHAQGCVLVSKADGRIHLRRARLHLDAADQALECGNYRALSASLRNWFWAFQKVAAL